MELKEYLKIIKKHKKVFSSIVFLVVLLVFLYYSFKPISYTSSIIIDVSRAGSQNTVDYKYDDFYRLQADEKFCETIVEWLSAPRVVEDIYEKAGIQTNDFTLKNLSKSIKAEKRSSQIVAITFSAPSLKISKDISNSLFDVISEKTQKLNVIQKEDTWFKIFSSDPVVKRDKPGIVIFLSTFLFGIFLGFWAVLIRHYLE